MHIVGGAAVRGHAGRLGRDSSRSAPRSSPCSRTTPPRASNRIRAWCCCSNPRAASRCASLHAGEITAIRTAAASAVATDALARKDAKRLAILGYRRAGGHTCARHQQSADVGDACALGPFPERAAGSSQRRLQRRIENSEIVVAPTTACAVVDADIVCTVTVGGRADHGGQVAAPWRAHQYCRLELCRASRSRQRRCDARRASSPTAAKASLRKARNSCSAKKAGLIGDDHIVGEIGEVLAGKIEGRRSAR